MRAKRCRVLRACTASILQDSAVVDHCSSADLPQSGQGTVTYLHSPSQFPLTIFPSFAQNSSWPISHKLHNPSPCPQRPPKRCPWPADKSQWHLWSFYQQQITMAALQKAPRNVLWVYCLARMMAKMFESPTALQVRLFLWSQY